VNSFFSEAIQLRSTPNRIMEESLGLSSEVAWERDFYQYEARMVHFNNVDLTDLTG